MCCRRPPPTVAALKLGHEDIDSYVIDMPDDIKLNETADKEGIYTYDDIVIDDAQHPLMP